MILDASGNPIQSVNRAPEISNREIGTRLHASTNYFEGDVDSPQSQRNRDLGYAYEGASPNNPDLAGFEPFNYSAQSALNFSRDRLANRIHSLVRDEGWAASSVTKAVEAVIGSGWTLHAEPDWKRMGVDQDEAQEFAESIEFAWNEYTNDPLSCDAEQKLNMTGILTLGFRHMMLDGEVCSLSCWIDDRYSEYSTAIQMLDPDRMSNPYLFIDSVERRGGVELDEHGAPKGYWFRSAHPGDLGVIGAFPWIWNYFERFYPNMSRQQVVHVFNPLRAGQVRGEPPLAPILRKLAMLKQYDESELQAAVINAILAAFIQTNNPEAAMERVGGGMNNMQESRMDYYGSAAIKMPNVRVGMLYPTDTVNLTRPQHPNQNFDNFMNAGLRNIASVAGITFESLTGNYAKVTYSSARAAIIEIWRGLMAKRGSFADSFLRPHYSNWLEEAIDMGKVKLPRKAPPFRDAKIAYTHFSVTGPSKGEVDPLKEVNSRVAKLSSGLSTFQKECSEDGLDWRKVMEQRAREKKYMESLGLNMEDLATAIAPKGITPGAGVQEDPKEPDEEDEAEAYSIESLYQ